MSSSTNEKPAADFLHGIAQKIELQVKTQIGTLGDPNRDVTITLKGIEAVAAACALMRSRKRTSKRAAA